ncbi:MAG: type II toxin-antitoxin system RelE/ParE family toxin [Myxococcota bacterium]|nr:type II toxin-antitoxin system RelE/ParE family toxin [Myxococcota bacterium]
MREVILRPEAERELTEAYQWYQERRSGLGDEFLLCVDAVIQQARRSPEMYRVAHRDVRRALVRRFPYGVFYVVRPKAIVVLAIFHGHRNPSVLHKRC